MITISIKGDVIKAFKENHYDVLVHGNNCFCNWGAGIAVQMRKNFPSAFKSDQATQFGDKSKLGTYSLSETKNGTIINAYTQYKYGGGRNNADLEAIRKVFEKIKFVENLEEIKKLLNA